MKGEWPVTIVSAFGRAETLALALFENGFQVQILDFTPAFPQETHRGTGPFPVVNKTHLPVQRDLLKFLQPLPQGLNLWLHDGPMDLSGPMSEVHAESHPELKAWKAGSGGSGSFHSAWLDRFLRQWASPFYSESWADEPGIAFPATQPLGVIPVSQEERVTSFVNLQGKGIKMHACTKLHDVRNEASRLTEVEVESSNRTAIQSQQWVWCLSSFETEQVGEEASKSIFWRGTLKPDWAWLSFEGTFDQGPWTVGLPNMTVVIADVFLPWAHANAFVLRRTETGKFRVWLKVPRERADNIDARRGWALGVENLLRSRLPQAEWRVDSAAWGLCAHSEIYDSKHRGEVAGSWKNWDWISPEVLPRLDLSARLEREAAAFHRLMAWRNEQLKKQGVPRDHAIHAP